MSPLPHPVVAGAHLTLLHLPLPLLPACGCRCSYLQSITDLDFDILLLLPPFVGAISLLPLLPLCRVPRFSCRWCCVHCRCTPRAAVISAGFQLLPVDLLPTVDSTCQTYFAIAPHLLPTVFTRSPLLVPSCCSTFLFHTAHGLLLFRPVMIIFCSSSQLTFTLLRWPFPSFTLYYWRTFIVLHSLRCSLPVVIIITSWFGGSVIYSVIITLNFWMVEQLNISFVFNLSCGLFGTFCIFVHMLNMLLNGI